MMSPSIIISALPSCSNDAPRCGLFCGAPDVGLRLQKRARPRFKFLGLENAEGAEEEARPRLRWFQVIALRTAVRGTNEDGKRCKRFKLAREPKVTCCPWICLLRIAAQREHQPPVRSLLCM
jgi:hypothetical protein